MINFCRLLLAQTLVHPLEGITFADWLRLLRREQLRVSPVCWPRALWLTVMSLWNSTAARAVERRFGAAIQATRVEAPVFILGHYRSGTTYLHELLALDNRFASPTRFQAFNPLTFLGTEAWLAPLVEPFMLPRRVQEDEVAQMVLTQLSPYMDWVWPRSRAGLGPYLTFRDAEPIEIAVWSAALNYFLKALTLRYERPIILKSPPHTARVRLLLQLFPDARFVHIRRDPYAVFVSTVRLLAAVRPVFRLQRGPKEIDVEMVLQTYATMYDAYFADRAEIPPGQLVEIGYEDLERNPMEQVRSVYNALALAEFEPVRPVLEDYLTSIAGYRKNRHPPLDDAMRRQIAHAWSRSFDEWGYPR
jgi:hypothetical protein